VSGSTRLSSGHLSFGVLAGNSLRPLSFKCKAKLQMFFLSLVFRSWPFDLSLQFATFHFSKVLLVGKKEIVCGLCVGEEEENGRHRRGPEAEGVQVSEFSFRFF